MSGETKKLMSEAEALRGLELIWSAVASVQLALTAIEDSELGKTPGTCKAEDALSQLEDSTAAVAALLQADRVRPRSQFKADATLVVQKTEWAASVSNVSVDGCGLSLLEPIESVVSIPFDGVQISRPGTIRWSRGLRVGVEFSTAKGVARQGGSERP